MEPTHYRIVVRGEPSDRVRAAFEGMDVRSAEGATVIVGEVLDQSHLQGLLERAARLGLELVSVEPVEPSAGAIGLTGRVTEMTTVSDAHGEGADRDQGGDGGAGR